MYPTFCTYRDHPELADACFAGVAEEQGLGETRPGLAIGEEKGAVEVIVSLDGRVARLLGAEVWYGVPEELALALMDAVEEAIEDTVDATPDDSDRVLAFEDLLAMMERALAF